MKWLVGGVLVAVLALSGVAGAASAVTRRDTASTTAFIALQERY